MPYRRSMTSLPPSSADARGANRARWRAATARVAAVSTTLAQRYQEHTAPVVGRADAAALDALADAGIALRAEAGWRGERLAQELFAAGRRALALLAPDDLVAGSRLALRFGGELDEVEFLHALPEEIAAWEPGLRSAWLTAALAAPPSLAAAVFHPLPPALAPIAAPPRPPPPCAAPHRAAAAPPARGRVAPPRHRRRRRAGGGHAADRRPPRQRSRDRTTRCRRAGGARG